MSLTCSSVSRSSCLPTTLAAIGNSRPLRSTSTASDIEAGRLAKEEAAKAEDDAKCRSANAKPGEPAYEACRQELATKRAANAEINYQKARDFDRVLGGLNDL